MLIIKGIKMFKRMMTSILILGMVVGQINPMRKPLSWDVGTVSCPRATHISFQKPTSVTSIVQAPAPAYPLLQRINQSFMDLLKSQSVPTALSQIVCRTEHPIVLLVTGEGMSIACSAYQSSVEMPNEFMGQIMAAQRVNALPISDGLLSGSGFGLGAVTTEQLIRRSSNKIATSTLLGLVTGLGFYATNSIDMSLVSPEFQSGITGMQGALMGMGLTVAQSLPTIINDFLETTQKQKDITKVARQAVQASPNKEINYSSNRMKATLSQITTALGKVTVVAVALGTTAYAASQDENDFISDETKETFANVLGTTLGLMGSTVAYEYAYRIAAQTTSVVTEYTSKALQSSCEFVESTRSGSYSWNKCKDFIKSFNPFKVPMTIK